MAMTMAMATASALSHASLQTYLVTSTSSNPSHPPFQFRPFSLNVKRRPRLSPGFLNSIDTSTAHVNINAIDNNLGIVTASRVKAFVSVSPVAAAQGGGDSAVVAEEGEGKGDKQGKGVETLGLISEADLLRKKAKKVRLRRKRLLRKRKLRKKGRWPPSKMAKNKNV
uniref:50S ribosomal protein 5, chloroplastic n=1 Tax=Picea sitchensis TaxID=3332 RepID=A9NN88_PICSI|nr:unknown [Picea sitchensis]